MSEVISAIREKIRYHEDQIQKLNRMLEVGGAAPKEDSLGERIKNELRAGPLSAGALREKIGCVAGTLYVKLSRMRSAGELSRFGKLYSIPEEP